MELSNNQMDCFYVYVIRSTEFNRNYVGFTRDLNRRIIDHNAGRTRSTKGYRPWAILFYETYRTKKEALNREKYLKTGQGRDYIKQRLLAS